MSHDHHHHHHENLSQKNLLIAFALNFIFAIVELVGGYFTNSVAIISDALHDFGDSLALLLAYFAQKISTKNADEIYTFGYRRFSILSALINSLVLLVGSTYVIYEGIIRLFNPEPVAPEGMLVLSILGIAVNSYAAYRLSKNDGLNSNVARLHLLEDVLGWFSVFIVSIVLIFKPWFFLDSLLSIIISIIILKGVYRSLKKVTLILLQRFPSDLDLKKLKTDIGNIDKVIDSHGIRAVSLDEDNIYLRLHIVVSKNTAMHEVDEIKLQLKERLKEYKVITSTIEFESDKSNCIED